MKTYLAAAALILLASAGTGQAQTVFGCSQTDPQADAAGACPGPVPVPNAPNVLQQNRTTSVDPGTRLVNPAGRSPVASVRTPRGMAPLVVPNDALGTGISNPGGRFGVPLDGHIATRPLAIR
jgi:hypothetical protein